MNFGRFTVICSPVTSSTCISLDVEGDGEHVFRWLFANDDPWGTSYSNSNRVWFKNVVVGSVSTITFDENYEDGSVFNELCAGKLGTLPVPKRDDYFMFTGWWTQREGGTQVTSETSVTGEATYYAHWAPTPYKFDGEWFEDVDGSWRPMATDTWTSYSATKDVEGPCTVSFKWKAVIFDGYHTVDIYDIVNGGSKYADNYTPEDLAAFTKYIDGQLTKVEPTLDQNELKDILLHIYSNPVLSKEDVPPLRP